MELLGWQDIVKASVDIYYIKYDGKEIIESEKCNTKRRKDVCVYGSTFVCVIMLHECVCCEFEKVSENRKLSE